jgi:Na+/melibiose symporter-like transporter
MTDNTGKLTFGEKFGYGLGDLAANFVFQASKRRSRPPTAA